MKLNTNRKGQSSSSRLLNLLLPAIVICVLAVCFGLITSDIGSNYGVTYTNTTYDALNNQTQKINDLSNSTANALLGDNTKQSNVLTSTERLVILILSDVPGIYLGMITVVATTLGIPGAIVGLFISGIILAIIAVVIWLILGRT
jgi:hypothetical protein